MKLLEVQKVHFRRCRKVILIILIFNKTYNNKTNYIKTYDAKRIEANKKKDNILLISILIMM